MDRLKEKALGIVILGLLPLGTSAQSAARFDTPAEGFIEPQVGGTPTVDLIRLRASGPGVPLRYGNVVAGSERVMLEGQVLQRGPDYAMDYEAGVVYLKRAQREGQSLTVNYRYDTSGKRPNPNPGAGFGGFKFDLMPGRLGMVMGLGMTERTADGNVLTSNVFGFNNSFSFGGGQMKGVMLFGDRQQADTESLYEYRSDPRDTPQGRSQMVLQNLETGLMGGKVQLDYQDVSKNFTSFNSARDSGLDGKVVDQLAKERGLKRMGLSLQDVNLGGLSFSNSFRTVEDEKGSIEWRSLGFKNGGLDVQWDSQRVDKDFKRFKDISEGNRDQLAKEGGLNRERLAAKFDAGVGKLSLNQQQISEAAGGSVRRREVGLDTGNIKFNLGDQEVDSNFRRMGSLMADERKMFGETRELGLKRQWMGLTASITGTGGQPLQFQSHMLSSKDGKFQSQDFGVGGKTWSLEHSVRSVDKTFNSLGALSPEETNQHIQSIAKMYSPDIKPKPEERNFFLQSRGLDRSYTRFGLTLFGDWQSEFRTVRVKGQNDEAVVETLDLGGKNFKFNARRQKLGEQFGEVMSLMQFERQQFGTIAGMERSDLGLTMKLGADRHLAASQTNIDTPGGGANRTSVAFADKRLEVQANAREVDPGFNQVRHLLDGEKDLLVGILGFKQRDFKVKWDLSSNLRIDAFLMDASSEQLEQERMVRNLALAWNPDKNTNLHYFKLEQRSNDPLDLLFVNNVERLTMSRDFGKGGKLRLMDERTEYDGTQTNLVSFRKQYLGYEAKLDEQTRLKTEQTRKSFDNGDHEHVSANTVSTQISNRVGVSLTDVSIDRSGDETSERKRNYGFWYDVGNNIRITYGYARHLLTDQPGTLNSHIGVTPGTIGGVKMEGAEYKVNQWDDTRTQAFSKVMLSSAKPIRLGFLEDVAFRFSLDTAADHAKWLRENQVFGFTGKVGGHTLAYEYKGQMHQSGFRGIDRYFQFATNKSEKNWLHASVQYKLRTLPWDEQVMIRNFDVTAKPSKNLSVTHRLRTNPEEAKGDAILGSITQAARSNEWNVDYKQDGNVTVGGSFKELINDRNRTMTRVSGLNVALFEKSGSPLRVFYGVEQADVRDDRKNTIRYHLQFDQQPGPNQSLSFFVGNVSYVGAFSSDWKPNNWTIRVDYMLRF
jgi:hypothetical protein